MDDLCLPGDCYQAMVEAAVASYPEECCGLLVGWRDAEQDVPGEVRQRTVVEVVALDNAWEASLLDYTDPAGGGSHGLGDRYYIDPADIFAVQRQVRQRGLEIIGVFHSHPDHGAMPSECDRTLAWPVYSYIIVSVMAGQVADFKSWRLNDQHQFEPEPVKMIGSSANKAPFLS